MFIYALKSAFALTILYSFFSLLLSRETFHRFNRSVLLFILFASVTIPFIHITTEHPTIVHEGIIQMQEQLSPLPTSPGGGIDSLPSGRGKVGALVLTLLYLLGVGIAALHFLWQLLMIFRETRGGMKVPDGKGNTIIVKDGTFAPHCFLRCIMINLTDYEQNRRVILAHEQEHIRLGHTYDLLFLQAVSVIQWFNPFVHLLATHLQAVHEYEADEAVINNGIDVTKYQQLLVMKALGNRLQTIVNSLNRGSLKQRIIMMKTQKSNPWMRAKSLYLVPITALALSAFATPRMKQTMSLATTALEEAQEELFADPLPQPLTDPLPPTPSPVKSEVEALPEVLTSIEAEKEEEENYVKAKHLFVEAYQHAVFPGGNSALRAYLRKHLTRPEGIAEGTTFFVCVSIVNDGTVYDATLYPVNESNAAAFEVIRATFKAMPKWIPGRTETGEEISSFINIPVTF